MCIRMREHDGVIGKDIWGDNVREAECSGKMVDK